MRDIGNWRHLCVDMQRMFLEETPWQAPWMMQALGKILPLATTFPSRTIFTRFIPPGKKQMAPGTWRDYYEKWWMMTGENLPEDLTRPAAELERLVPPAVIFDKSVYSPWLDGRLHRILKEQEVTSLVISGGETDVCVMATTLGAVEFGYRIFLLEDAVFGGNDATHDAALKLLGDRFSVQLELIDTGTILRQLI